MKPLLALVFSIQAYLALSDVCSPDPCPAGQTCCPTSTPGMAGCCPAPNAVCCSDKVHCCPHNTNCNLEKGTCEDKTVELIPFPFHKPENIFVPSINSVVMKEAKKVERVYCPDGKSYCPDNNTCCRLSTGQYGCCPYPSATCCSDGVHCCPNGSRCDPTATYCIPSSYSPWNVAPKRPRMPALALPILI